MTRRLYPRATDRRGREYRVVLPYYHSRACPSGCVGDCEYYEERRDQLLDRQHAILTFPFGREPAPVTGEVRTVVWNPEIDGQPPLDAWIGTVVRKARKVRHPMPAGRG